MNLTAYQLADPAGFTLVPAPVTRSWMAQTAHHAAAKCLPLLMANQAGWHITCPATVRMRWTGGPLLSDIEMQCQSDQGPDHLYPVSHFGQGIVTWTLPFLFRTEQGYNLLVRGPANTPKDGIAPLEGLVETDWTVATFTVNWQITRSDYWITFSQGEPIALLVPQRRGELEEFTPALRLITEDPDLDAAVELWQAQREQTHQAFAGGIPQFEKDYFAGRSPQGQISEHQTRLNLRGFND